MGSKLLIAAALVCAVVAPALAYSQGPSIHAEDSRWVSSAGGTDLTVTKGTTVEFAYPSGTNSHTLAWTSAAKPVCKDVPMSFVYAKGVAPWQGTCTFSEPGTYTFRCNFHDFMTGTVKVTEPVASASPTASATPTGASAPEPGASPTPSTTSDPTQIQQTQAPLSAKVASAQKGTSVRGSVVVAQQASRVEVTVALGKRRVGRYLKHAAASGTKTFTVALDAKTRRTLKRKHSLKLSVTVAVTPQGGAEQSRAFNVRLRG